MDARRRGWVWIVAALLMVLVVYPFSKGPYLYLAVRCGASPVPSRTAGVWIYKPISYALEFVPDEVREPYLDYCSWFWMRGSEARSE